MDKCKFNRSVSIAHYNIQNDQADGMDYAVVWAEKNITELESQLSTVTKQRDHWIERYNKRLSQVEELKAALISLSDYALSLLTDYDLDEAIQRASDGISKPNDEYILAAYDRKRSQINTADDGVRDG